MIKDGCQYFMCRHSDEPRLLKAYSVGYMEACEWFLNWAKRNNIQRGSISDDDLCGIYAQIECNYQETACIAEELPNIEE